MRYLSVCSGIEAASVAWHPLGWRAVALSEIEPYPCDLLAHRYPDVPNLGDMTKFQEWPDAAIDVLVGGTPCQAFSVAGFRKGLADPRGNLTLTFLAIAARYRPRWVVWENVPGVFSDDTGAFGTFLGGLAELGYGLAYRTLDAQYWGVAQRRRRPFVVGYLGDWRRAGAVLFDRESLSWNPPPSRETREDPAGTIGARTGRSSGAQDAACGHMIAETMRGHPRPGSATIGMTIAHTLRADGFDASEDGSGKGTPLVPTVSLCLNAGGMGRIDGESETMIPVAFDCKASGRNGFGVGEITPTLRAMGHKNTHSNAGGQLAAKIGLRVRRLTPRECERLQGFPDDYTLIPRGNGKLAADGPRYKALGNSMPVPVMRWIGERIQLVHALPVAA